MRQRLLIAAFFSLCGPAAQAGELYRCTDGAGASTYVAKVIPGQTCKLFSSYTPGPAETTMPLQGKVYSYVLDGTRYFSSRPPANPRATDVRAINYGYDAVVRPPTPAPVAPVVYSGRRTFQGYPCTEDCSGHEAGYDWAERRGIEHPDECGGRSRSFIEGCAVYAEEVQQEMIEDGECADDDGDELCDDY